MKKYHDNSTLLNESTAEDRVMDSLFDLCVDKHGGSSIADVEKHFLNMLASIVNRGELSIESVKRFLEEKGIEGELPKKRSPITTSPYNDGGCGYSPTRSHC